MIPGTKHDQAKPRYDLVPMREFEDVVRVLTYGSTKYADDNWKHVPDARKRYYSAAMRHMSAWMRGELKDPETGISHLAHAQASLLFMQWFDNEEEIRKCNPSA